MITIDVPGAYSTSCSGINSSGIVGGFFNGPQGRTQGFTRTPAGVFVSFEVPGSSATLPIGINGFGAVAGLYKDARSNFHGFIRTPSGVITPFDVPGSLYTYPFAINGAGAITGAYRTDIDASFVRSPPERSPRLTFRAQTTLQYPRVSMQRAISLDTTSTVRWVRYLIALSALRMGVSRRSTHREL